MPRDRKGDRPTTADVAQDLPPDAAAPLNLHSRRVGPEGVALVRLEAMVATKQVRRWLHRQDAVDFGILGLPGPGIEWVEPTAYDSTLQLLLDRIQAGQVECDPVGHFALYKALTGATR